MPWQVEGPTVHYENGISCWRLASGFRVLQSCYLNYIPVYWGWGQYLLLLTVCVVWKRLRWASRHRPVSRQQDRAHVAPVCPQHAVPVPPEHGNVSL